ncbi:MAG: hypothetical protein EPO61_08155 [Nitrospirae bacterium]|nr:MAG: hypothetical protein EPO61_08155 [Nitrospirota bacterium]
MLPSLRAGGCFFVALLLFVCLVGLPSSQASDVSLTQAALEDWDEADPAEDKGALPLSDHQQDFAGCYLSLLSPAVARSTSDPQRPGGSSYLLLRFSVARAPPVR